MGFFDTLGRIASSVANSAANSMADKADRYSSGYARGSERAGDMSTAELRESLRRAKDSNLSDWKKAGEVRAMADEYKNRTK
ncbi:MAG: hypothetical protein J6J43_07710 [Oscillospiraceae bacterium]|nr:hypothetical protein [Oscillospiraceae bacterium]